ncbi:MAG TPA: hypothetical protein VHS58_16000, partial [Acetobacteraceae bacterium]|nr:hypothetical protein [Acetobacteraceae bacterium]
MGTLRFRPGLVVFMLPALTLYALFFLVPFVRTLYGSLLDWNGIGAARFVGFDNFLALAHDDLFRVGIERVGLWAVLAVVFKVGIALVLASMLRVPI